jgi:hypothetical protein
MIAIGVRLIVGGGNEPSPTRDRRVSGKKLSVSLALQLWTYKNMGIRHIALAIVRNQKIDLQPRYSANMPPMAGPTKVSDRTPKTAY